MKAIPIVAIFRLIAPLALLAWLGWAANAQADRCRQTIDNAFSSIGQNCAGLEANSLCYSHPKVEARFADDTYFEDFSSPSQRARARSLASVHTSALDLEAAGWGVAVINLGAKFPRTYEGPGILIALAGAAEITNEIDPGSAPQIGEPLSTAALSATTLFKNPGIIPEPIGSVAADELLLVDAYDDTGDWLRVVNGGKIAWVASEDLARLKAMTALPRMSIGAPFPFQALSLATAADYPGCAEAEAMVAIQTPADMPANLTINGVDMHIGSMVTFQQVHRNALSLTVHRGKVTTVFGQSAQPGESMIAILGRSAEREAQALDWSSALPASKAELARGQRAQALFNNLARANGWRQHKTFGVPPPLLHYVAPGDTLYSIARRYQTSVAEIILANLSDEPIKLYSGAALVIPNPGSGFAGHGTVALDAIREE